MYVCVWACTLVLRMYQTMVRFGYGFQCKYESLFAHENTVSYLYTFYVFNMFDTYMRAAL